MTFHFFLKSEILRVLFIFSDISYLVAELSEFEIIINLTEMEELLSRFPHVSEEIFGKLNDKSLVDCRSGAAELEIQGGST